MPDIAHITDLLHRSQTALYAAAGNISEDTWREPPAPGAWSAAEVFAHLSMVEEAITAGMARMLDAPPKKLALRQRLHLPVRLAQFRQLKLKTPIPLDSAFVLDKAESLARHTALRKRALQLLADNAGRDLGAYRHKHPFFGYLDVCQWYRSIGFHELRHSEQIQEIVEVFQK